MVKNTGCSFKDQGWFSAPMRHLITSIIPVAGCLVHSSDLLRSRNTHVAQKYGQKKHAVTENNPLIKRKSILSRSRKITFTAWGQGPTDAMVSR